MRMRRTLATLAGLGVVGLIAVGAVLGQSGSGSETQMPPAMAARLDPGSLSEVGRGEGLTYHRATTRDPEAGRLECLAVLGAETAGFACDTPAVVADRGIVVLTDAPRNEVVVGAYLPPRFVRARAGATTHEIRDGFVAFRAALGSGPVRFEGEGVNIEVPVPGARQPAG